MSILVENGMISAGDLGQKGLPDGEYMTSSEYAEAYHVTLGTIRQWRKRGLLRSYILMDGSVIIPAGETPKKRHFNGALQSVTKKT